MQKLLPNDIPLSEIKGIGNFSPIENNVAWAIVKFCQVGNTWREFTAEDLQPFILMRFISYILDSMMIGHELVEKRGNLYTATDKFISGLMNQNIS
ncbi:MAG: hypothetical protein A3A13_01470 [Candidatus Yanofskybacteria bacterium RIFCSPLOWO2_01_FULL_43_22]|uniref:Uncharacterized protein n=1 Tax=Candidatus Yanofskybacteria bacterium RIFCSPLOWO2_01_FULL_43_22 TaxID=1802695 RepID=A0A1F8GHZ8_9BACT|nr:MAG: hypothetical protein A3A13_01470 [Candidatus Yanofskybacteria bacterium RIFCSPLOWO2_01_FULL_43_22]